ncbi:hypothetical protein JHK86_052348 [Glycine max]|nr:hypothetical protein JHK86_052348 [Glycine max]
MVTPEKHVPLKKHLHLCALLCKPAPLHLRSITIAALVYLYDHLSYVSLDDNKQCGDYMTLLMVFEHLPSVGYSNPEDYSDGDPLNTRWNPLGDLEVVSNDIVLRRQQDLCSSKLETMFAFTFTILYSTSATRAIFSP